MDQSVTIKQDGQARITKALSTYHRGLSIEGTLAETYLRVRRGITWKLPEDFWFLAKDRHFQTKKFLPALVVPYRDKDNQIVGIVRIYLNPDGSQYRDTFIDAKKERVKATPKVNQGISSHGSVTVQEGILPMTLWIAEGVETALSVAQAAPNQRVVASLSVGQISNVPLSPEVQTVVICADNDPASSNSKQGVVKVVESFLSQGVKVFIALPPGISKGMDKYDFNDLLKRKGIEAVEKVLEESLEIKEVNILKTDELRLETDLNRIRGSRANDTLTKIQSISVEREIKVKVRELKR